MAATLEQDASLAADPTFRLRVQSAIVRRVHTLLAGNLSSDQLSLARAILYDPPAYAATLAYGCVTESAINARNGVQTAVTDAEVIAAVNAVVARYVR
jgi:hypothetical protein